MIKNTKEYQEYLQNRYLPMIELVISNKVNATIVYKIHRKM
jgi:hypothetical protein